MKRIVIIGGGITGLTAAFHLQEKAHQSGQELDYLVVERESRLGGKILTEKVDDFVIEAGPDAFLAERPWVFELAGRIGLERHLLGTNEQNKGTFVFSRGRLHPLPEGLVLMVPSRIGPFLASSLISWPGKLRMILDLFIPKKRDGGDESLARFVTRRLGREALEKIAEPLVAGIHSADPERMSLRASFPRFLDMEQKYGSLIRAMLAKAAGVAGKAAAQVAGGKRPATPERGDSGRDNSTAGLRRTYFMSFREGIGELPAAVAARLDPTKLLTGKTVTHIEERRPQSGQGEAQPGPRYLVHIEGMEPVPADAVIITAPAHDAARLMEPLDRGIAADLAAIPMASTATVTLVYRRAELSRKLEGFGFVIPRIEHRRIMAVTYMSRKWPHRTPDDEFVMLRAFIGGPEGQERVQLDDASLVQMVREELAEILGITAKPHLTRVYRWIKSMHQYVLGHLDRVARIEAGLARHPSLYLAGGAYRGVGIGNCIHSATVAADHAWADLAGPVPSA